MRREIGPTVIVAVAVVALILIGLYGWRTFRPRASYGGNPYENMPASMGRPSGSGGYMPPGASSGSMGRRPMSGGPMSGGPMSGGYMSGGPMSGGPMSGGPMSGGAPAPSSGGR